MAKPGNLRSFDAFTPTGSGGRVPSPFEGNPPKTGNRYKGKPAYVTGPQERAQIRKRGL